MKNKLKKILQNINEHNTYVAIFSLIISIFSIIWNYSLQEKNTRFNTYNMDLCYSIEFAEDIKEENLFFYDETEEAIVISGIKYVNIIPKCGGINSVSIIFNHEKEDFVFSSFGNTLPNLVNVSEAQDAPCSFEDFLLYLYAEDDYKYYSSAFLVIEDYNHNYYSNMIVFEINKNDFTDIEERIYSEGDLLYTYNKYEGYLDFFDYEQMKIYLNLKNKLDKILK